MVKLSQAAGVLALCVMAAGAWAQAAGVSGDGAGGGGGGGLTIAPPEPIKPVSVSSGALAPVHGNTPMTTNALIGSVNDQPVFLLDVFRPIDEDLRRLAKTSKTLGDFREKARSLIGSQLQSLESEYMVLSAAQATLTDQDKERLDHYGKTEGLDLISKHGGSAAAADKSFQATGSSLEKEMADRRRKHIVDFYFYKNLFPRIQVTRSMEVAAYERDPKHWQQEAQVELYTITLPVSRWLRAPSDNGTLGPVLKNPTAEQIKAAEGQALATGREIVGKLKSGTATDFAALVEDYRSRDDKAVTGGRWPGVKKDSLNAKLAEYVFSLPAHTVGEPLLIRDADFNQSIVVVAKVGDKTEARTVPFEEAQKQIEQALRDQQFQVLREQEMRKLMQGASIEAIDPMLDVAVNAAVTRYATN